MSDDREEKEADDEGEVTTVERGLGLEVGQVFEGV